MGGFPDAIPLKTLLCHDVLAIRMDNISKVNPVHSFHFLEEIVLVRNRANTNSGALRNFALKSPFMVHDYLQPLK